MYMLKVVHGILRKKRGAFYSLLKPLATKSKHNIVVVVLADIFEWGGIHVMP